MNKFTRKLLILALVAALVFAVCAMVACNFTESHSHTYANGWTSDETSHWHAATCEHSDKVSGKAVHTFVNGVCSVCGYTASSTGGNTGDNTGGNTGENTGGSTGGSGTGGGSDNTGSGGTGSGSDNTGGGTGGNSGDDNTGDDNTGGGNDDNTGDTGGNTDTKTYTVTFVAEGVTVDVVEYKAGDTSVTEPAVPAKIGYYGAWESYTLNGSNLTVNAVYTAKTYMVTLDYNGADGNIGASTITVTYNQPVGTLPTPTKTGYGLDGWFLGDTLITSNVIWQTDTDSQIQLIAKWNENYMGLQFTLGSNGTVYYVSGVGTLEETDIEIPSTHMDKPVVGILFEAFAGCKDLTSVIIPDSIEIIANNAFMNCSNLKYVTFAGESRIARIGFAEFSGCSSLESINIPSSVECIEGHAFYGCSKLTEITIPAKVTTIGSYAFQNCTSIKSVTIETDTQLQKVEASAFYGCSNIEAVYVSDIDSWCRIHFGDYAYSTPMFYATNLFVDGEIIAGNITLSNDITEISAYTFKNSSITSITIPASISTIGSSAFLNCENLETVIWNATNCNYAGNRESSTKDYTIFKGCTNLTTVEVSKNVQILPDFVFYSCTGLQIVTIQADSELSTIGTGAFYGCTKLNTITLENSDHLESIADSAFGQCSALQSMTLPESLTSLGVSVFSNCTSLEIVYWYAKYCTTSVNSSINAIFASCSNLTEIVVGENVRYIPSFLFNSSYLDKVYISDLAAWCNIDFEERSISNLMYYANYLYLNDELISGDLELSNEVTKIPDYTFKNSELTSIIIPTSVLSIGAGAFMRCASLVSITLPFVGNSAEASSTSSQSLFGYIFGTSKYDGCIEIKQYYNYSSYSVTYYLPAGLTSVKMVGNAGIPYGAFYNCVNLTEVKLSNGTTAIASNAFYGCSGLTDMSIPASVTSIGHYAFQNCAGLVSVTFDDGCALSSIEYSVFYGCTSLESFTILPSVTSIENYAFYNCESLADLNFSVSGSLRSIGEEAFSGCKKLTGIELPTGVETIGKAAFKNCSSLVEISIPDSVTSIGAEMVYGCGKLESITIPFVGTSATASATSNVHLFGWIFSVSSFSGAVATRQYYTSSSYLTYYIPSSLKSVTVLGGNISYGAFYNCSNITDIAILDEVTYIGVNAFYGCLNLAAVKISSLEAWCNIEFAAASANPLYYAHNLYLNNSRVTELVMPQEVLNISAYAFTGGNFDSLVISEHVNYAGTDAFYSCTSLSTVYWNAVNCATAGSSYYPIFRNCTGLTTVVIGNGVQSLPSYAFKNCTGLTSITIPESVVSIKSEVFSGCTSLQAVHISSLIAWCNIDMVTNPLSVAHNLYLNNQLITALEIPREVTVLKNSTFAGGNFTSVTIHEDISEMGSSVFEGCTNLTTVYWNAINCQSAGSTYSPLFENCTKLTNIVIGDNVVRIPSYAFAYCTSLKSINIPGKVTTIGYEAFQHCEGMTSIVIPNNVTTIEFSAFGYCISLKNISIPDSVTTLGDSIFVGCTSLQTVVFEGNSLVTTINYMMFYGCSSLTGITLPSVVTEIDSNAFSNCTSLTSITLPEGIESIGSNAFSGCQSLSSINLPQSLTAIWGYAFYNCSKLTSIVIPEGVSALRTQVFGNCTILNNIVIPASVTSIDDSAFAYCNKLSVVYYGGTMEQWSQISIGSISNTSLTKATRYYYSENAPALNDDGTAYDGNYWHWAADGVTPEVWVYSQED